MNAILKSTLAVASIVLTAHATAQVTFYEREDFEGRSFTTQQRVNNFARFGFNDRSSSVVVTTDLWEVCDDARFSGRCVVLRPGRYSSLTAMGLGDRVSSARRLDRNTWIDDSRYAPLPAAAATGSHVTFYENEGFSGRTFTASQPVNNFDSYGFNDRASSAVVLGERWEVCENVRYGGLCVVLRSGRYPSLSAMGLNDRVSSVRAVNRNARFEDNRYAPTPPLAYDNRRRNNERLYEANVTSVRAVIGTPEKRCWIEREQVVQDRNNANVPGAIVGAIIGGVLGHQVGGGRGKDLATAGGAIAGGVLGSNAGGGQQMATQDVQRCASVPSQTRPEFWDVTYSFRGQEYRMQVTTPPGASVMVNERGEPRV
jgi:uncharacterized protein YcfJ